MNTAAVNVHLDDELRRIVEARHHDPFTVLGRHDMDGQTVIRVYIPYAMEVTIADGGLAMSCGATRT